MAENVRNFVDMCQMNEQALLSGRGNTQVNWCDCCSKYSVYYKNICFAFSEAEFDTFREVLGKLRPQHFQYYLSEEPQVLLRNHASNSGLFLTQGEVKHILQLMQEAYLMRDVHTLLNS